MAPITTVLGDITTLASLLDECIATVGSDEAFMFAPAFATGVRTIAAEITTAEAADTGGAAADVTRGALQQTLHDYVDGVQAAYAMRRPADHPTWLRPAQGMRDVDFYAAFFAGLAAVDADFLAWLDQYGPMPRTTAMTAHEQWVAAGTPVASAGYIRLQRALDLRAALEGVLRLYGLSQAAIRATRIEVA